MGDVNATIDDIDAALSRYGPPPAPPGSGGSPVDNTIAAIDAALAQHAPQGSYPTGGKLLSDADLGLFYPETAPSSPTQNDPRELTVRPLRQPAPAQSMDAGPHAAGNAALSGPTLGSTPSSEKLLSDEDLGLGPYPAAPTNKLLSDADLGLAPQHPGPLANSPDDGFVSGALKGTGTAAVKAVGNQVGFVGGLGNFADYLLARAEHAITGKPVETILSELAKQKQVVQRSIGAPAALDPRNVFPAPADISGPILKRTGEYLPESYPGKLAQSGAEAALSMFGPGAGSRVGTLGEIARGGIAAAPAAFTAGAVGQGVTDLTGDPLAGSLGGVIGGATLGGAGKVAAAGVKTVAAPVAMGVSALERVPGVGSTIGAARDRAAGGKLLGSSGDPAALRDWAAQPLTDGEVPGSPRTLAGTMGDDRKLFQAEKAARGVDNTTFNAMDDAQAAAQKQAITAPYQAGDVFRPGQVIRDRLSAIDAAHDEVVARLKTAHENAVAGRKAADEQTLDRMTVAFADAHSRATQAAQDAAAPLDAVPHPEVVGATYRTAHAEATEAARQAKQALYDAVDPEGTLATAVTPLKEATAAIRSSIDPHVGVQPSGAEARLHADIDRMPDVISFQALQKLDSRATAAMVDARKNPNPEDPEAIIRLTRLKGAVLDAIHSGTETAAAHEARLVQAGQLDPADTIRSKIAEWVQGHYDRQADVVTARVAGDRGSPAGAPGGGPAGAPGGVREEGAGDRGPGRDAGAEGVSAPPRVGAQQPEGLTPRGAIAYQAPDFGNRTVSARMHAPETAAALGQDVPGTVVRPYGGPLDARMPAGQPEEAGIVAYHGTPYEFDRFDSAHIGRGDGRQVQGSGINLSSSRDLAANYAEDVTKRTASSLNHGPLKIDGAFVRPDFENPRYMAADALIKQGGDAAKAASKLRNGMMADLPEAQEAARLIEAGEVRNVEKPTPNVLQVRIAKHPSTFLDWDKPYSEQTPFVRAAIDRAGLKPSRGEDPAGSEIYSKGTSGPEELAGIHAENRGFSKRLSDAGVSGVSYTDSHKNYEGAKAGSLYDGLRNFVVFNDGDVHVTHKNGVELARPVELPQFLMGQARASWSGELKASGVRGDSFSPDLTRNAMRLVGEGRHLDHGVAYENAFLSRAPKEGVDAIYGRPASQDGRMASGQSEAGAAQRGGLRDAGQGRGQPGQDRGTPREDGSTSGLAPNFDQGAVDRLSAAKAAHADYERTYKNPIVEPILATNGFTGQYTLPSGAIPSKAIVPGDKGYETAKAFIDASGRDPRAIAAMQDASVSLLRKHFPPAGTLHPNAVSRWKEHLDGALRAIDEVAPGFSSRFDNAANATQAMLDLGLEQKQAIADFRRDAAARALQMDEMSEATMKAGLARAKGMTDAARNSPAAKFLGQGGDRISPVEVENAVGNMLKTGTSGATRMRSLVASVASDPDALAGLQKAGTDWMARTFTTADDGMAGSRFIKFYRDNKDVLIELYGTAHTNMIGAVASDMERNARWRTTTAAKGGSDTSPNMRPWLTEESKQAAKHISLMTAAIEGIQAGYHIGGLKGAAVAAAAPTAYLLHNLRSAGIHSVDALYREALANPEVARRLISKMPPVPEGAPLRQLVGLLRRELIVGPQELEAKRSVVH